MSILDNCFGSLISAAVFFWNAVKLHWKSVLQAVVAAVVSFVLMIIASIFTTIILVVVASYTIAIAPVVIIFFGVLGSAVSLSKVRTTLQAANNQQQDSKLKVAILTLIQGVVLGLLIVIAAFHANSLTQQGLDNQLKELNMKYIPWLQLEQKKEKVNKYQEVTSRFL
jgi:hypothetical protein